MANTVLGAVNGVAGVGMGVKNLAVYTYKASTGKADVVNDTKSAYNGVSSSYKKKFTSKPVTEQMKIVGYTVTSPDFYGGVVGFLSLGALILQKAERQ